MSAGSMRKYEMIMEKKVSDPLNLSQSMKDYDSVQSEYKSKFELN